MSQEPGKDLGLYTVAIKKVQWECNLLGMVVRVTRDEVGEMENINHFERGLAIPN